MKHNEKHQFDCKPKTSKEINCSTHKHICRLCNFELKEGTPINSFNWNEYETQGKCTHYKKPKK